MKLFLAIVLVAIVAVACTQVNQYFGLKNDNVIETNIENLIEYQTGIKIDLTPEDPDNDDYTFDIWKEK